MGYHTAAFILDDGLRDRVAGDALSTLNLPGRQVAVYPIRGERLATFFVFKARGPVEDLSAEGAARELAAVYEDVNWVVPELLDRLDRSSLYFDEVSQIALPGWSRGPVVLVGDAAYCVSLVAGQGASMAMAGAYILADELARSGGDLAAGLSAYEKRLRPRVEAIQASARRLAGWFVPANRTQQAINALLTRMIEWPLAWRFVRRMLAPGSLFES
jgi:2-polyprenyl-6-methoxyphenol hydroxylase-like FAD-dependent oxidoreductase